jgi:hypothetical protein
VQAYGLPKLVVDRKLHIFNVLRESVQNTGQKTQSLKHSVSTTVFDDGVCSTAFEHGIVARLFTKKGQTVMPAPIAFTYLV